VTPAERALWLRMQRRAGRISPDFARSLLDAYAIIREALSPAEITRLIDAGQIDAIIDDALLDRAVLNVRATIAETVKKGFQSTIPELPKGGKVDGQVAVAFDTLNPRVIDGIRELDSRVINTLKQEIRDTVRAHIENGLRDGKAPRTVARDLRQVIGLAPNQEEAVRNFERALRGENPNASPTDYKLRDRRFDALLRKGELTEAQIEKMTEAYRRKMLAFNAETNARTATLDAQKLGQKLSWDAAIEKGIVDPSNLYKRWVSVGDDRVRDEHVAMHGEEVPYQNHYSNGEDVPGESTFNCRCVSLFLVRRAA
jgi:hypothetical protein